MNHSSLILTKQEPTKYYSRDEPYSASFPSLDYKISGDDVTFDMSVEYHCPFHYWKYYITILGSCNGLICLQSDPELLFVWNPITNDYHKLPQAPNEPQGVVFPVKIFGFGYDCKTGDYKVVKIFMPGRVKLSKVWIYIYTLGTNSWRVLADVPYVFFLSGELKNGTGLNGLLRWLVHPLGRGNRPIRIVLCFDVGNEKFGEMHLPIPLCGAPEGVNYFKTSIGLLDGKLCLSWYVSDGNVDVCVMKNYGVTESWTKLFRVSWLKEDNGYLRAIQSLKR
ncbi:F-box/kelch-repeat protein At3g06240-like [Papaver somniferum]|uniref:F-box/kelch-repeat protein At3g06240-like n=1 Tax=Papaver somniferum TaxID=3469 RepID=UPI000E704597|nr:F-box/kelch-repeat protein At3g06240-like [Papaver somniferum]